MNLSTRALLDAVPVYFSGGDFLNLEDSGYFQVKTGLGVLGGVTVNAGGTGSSVALFDGKSSTVTVSLATPGVVTWAAHPFVAGGSVKFTTTGALPTGLTAGTTYFVAVTDIGVNSFKLSDTKAHALAGTNLVATSVSQSGVHTAWDVSRPIATFATTALASVPMSPVGVRFPNGLIAIAADGGGAANVTISFL